MEVLEEEVAEKKSEEIFVRVAEACSIGAQMTLIMGGGALLFRYGCQARHLQIARCASAVYTGTVMEAIDASGIHF